MQTIKMSEDIALRTYPTATAEFKSMLEDTFGKQFFNQKITDRVKSFKDACKILNIDPNDVLPPRVGIAMENDKVSIEAYTKIIIIARALNEGWQPDWENSSQYKYYPWFKANKAGSGLSYVVYDDWLTDTNIGSRLCFKSAELATYAGQQFGDIYNEFLNIQ